MKKSRYNIFIKRPGFTICFNSFTDSLLAVSNEAYDAYRNETPEKFATMFPAHYSQFADSGFLIADHRDELEEIRELYRKEVKNSRDYHLMIYPTQDCNLNCWYCYENHVLGSRMNSDIQQRTIRFMQRKLEEGIDSVNLSFFGGEPLLYFDDIAYPLSRSIQRLCEQYGKPFTTFFITNGSLITDRMIGKLKEINPFFQITLDGNRAKHNKVRIGKLNAHPTYDHIIRAVKSITEQLVSSHKAVSRIVTLRINYDNDTLRNIDEIIDDIREIDRRKISIHLERVWQTLDQIDSGQRVLFTSAFRKLIHAGFNVSHGIFGKKQVACPAEKHDYAVINYNGNVYRCNGRDLTPDKAEGVLHENGTITWKQEKLACRLGKATFDNPMCLSCKMLPNCLGPCSQKNMEHAGGDLSRACSMNALEIPLKEYLLLRSEMEFLERQRQKQTS